MNCRHDDMNKLSLALTAYLMDHGYFTNCLNCHNWQDKNEICSKYNQRPPALIIIKGCSEHTDIPF